MTTDHAYEIRYQVIRPDGTRRVVRGRGNVELAPDGTRVLRGAAQDVTEHDYAVGRLVAAESRYRAIVEHANDGIWILDRAGRTRFVNRRLTEMIGLTPAEILGRAPSEIAADELPDLRAERRTQFEARFCRPDGRDVWGMGSVSSLPEAHGGGLLLVVSDITVRKQMEERLRQAAERDPLTGLLNRARFESVLNELLADASRAVTRPALLFLDLDHFKYVNDAFGHAVGDALLREVGTTLSDIVRDGDVVGRFAGDEFLIALCDADRAASLAVAERMMGAIRSRRWQTLSRLTASIGIALTSSERPTTAAELLIAADAALHDAKSNGRDQVIVCSGQGRAGFQWVDEIRAALEDERLVLHAQAIEPLREGGVRRYELLVRMRSRDGSLIPPGHFIPAAEQFGLMVEVDRWVVRRALRLAQGGMPVQINLSGSSLGDREIQERVQSAITEGLEPDLLTFEVTETAAVRNLESAREFAMGLRRLGCLLALDDFGTGFASLTYLKYLPVSQVKIDIEFVQHLTTSPEDQRLVTALVEMARPLGLETVAEGVEDQATLEILRDIGVDYVQGFGIEMPFELELENRPTAKSEPKRG